MGIDNENLEMVELLLENKVVTSTMIIMITIMITIIMMITIMVIMIMIVIMIIIEIRRRKWLGGDERRATSCNQRGVC